MDIEVLHYHVVTEPVALVEILPVVKHMGRIRLSNPVEMDSIPIHAMLSINDEGE